MTTAGGGFGGGGIGSGQSAATPDSSKGVFISHASEDAPIAQAFCNLIHDVSAGMIPTYSSSSKNQGAGIPYGADWFTWIEERIRESGNVVALVTPASIGRPWILFEAGFGRAIEGVRVFGLRLQTTGEDAYVGPFLAFQNSGSDPDSLLKLCTQLFEGTNCRPREEMVLGQIDNFLVAVAGHFRQQESTPVKINPESEAFFRALEEMKTLVQARTFISADEVDEARLIEIEYVFHVVMKSRGSDIRPEARAMLLLGIASEVGLAWIVPLIQYAINHPVRIEKVLRPMLDDRMFRSRKFRRSPIPPEIILEELFHAVEEAQMSKFHARRNREDEGSIVDRLGEEGS
ncbi:Toll/interleukin-1 receptor homology (TIR) domain containing protein [Fimbriimonadaceae bacterium]